MRSKPGLGLGGSGIRFKSLEAQAEMPGFGRHSVVEWPMGLRCQGYWGSC